MFVLLKHQNIYIPNHILIMTMEQKIGFNQLTPLMKIITIIGCGAGLFFILWIIMSILIAILWV